MPTILVSTCVFVHSFVHHMRACVCFNVCGCTDHSHGYEPMRVRPLGAFEPMLTRNYILFLPHAKTCTQTKKDALHALGVSSRALWSADSLTCLCICVIILRINNVMQRAQHFEVYAMYSVDGARWKNKYGQSEQIKGLLQCAEH